MGHAREQVGGAGVQPFKLIEAGPACVNAFCSGEPRPAAASTRPAPPASPSAASERISGRYTTPHHNTPNHNTSAQHNTSARTCGSGRRYPVSLSGTCSLARPGHWQYMLVWVQSSALQTIDSGLALRQRGPGSSEAQRLPPRIWKRQVCPAGAQQAQQRCRYLMAGFQAGHAARPK